MSIDRLGVFVADYIVLYQKLRSFHWTVTGPHFYQLHPTFEKLYDAAAEAGDAIAERIVALGGRPPTTLEGALKIAHLREEKGALGADEMVRAAIADLDHLNGELRAIAGEVEDEDRGTADILDDIADAQEKETWMLRAFAGESGGGGGVTGDGEATSRTRTRSGTGSRKGAGA